MDLFGVGPLELFFIVILALIILGPKDMEKTGKTIGRWLNNLVRSDTWKMIRQTSNKIKYLPNELMREAGMEEIRNAGKAVENEIKDEITNASIDPFESWRGHQIWKSPANVTSSKSSDSLDPEKGSGEDA